MSLFAAQNGTERFDRGKIFTFGVFLEGGLAIVAWFLGKVFKTPAFGSLDLTLEAIGLGLLGVLPLLAGLWLTTWLNWAPFTRLRHDLHRLVAVIFKDNSVAELAVISALAGVGEEALFRGFLQPWIANWGGLGAALLVTNLIFGSLHLISLPYGFMAFGVGIYLSILQIASGNLLVPVITHAVYDFIGLVYLVRFTKATGALTSSPSGDEPQSAG